MEFSEKEKEEIKAIAKEILNQLQQEIKKAEKAKEETKQKIKKVDEINELLEIVAKKEEKFLGDENKMTLENMQKFENIYKTLDSFLDSVERKSNQ